MKLSINFLKTYLKHTFTEVYATGSCRLRYKTLLLYTPGCLLQPETLYFCPPDTMESFPEKIFEEKRCGIVWTDHLKKPPSVSEILWIKEKKEPLLLFSEISLQIASLNGHLCHIWRPACDLNGGQPRTH